jgi:hypothetical protein
MDEIETIEDLRKIINHMAREFYAMMGYRVEKEYNFYMATHPQERK